MWSLLVLLLVALACLFAGWPIWRGGADGAGDGAERWSRAEGDMNASRDD